MAGGLFGQPFALNIKCIIFSLIIMVIFLIKPKINNSIVLYLTLFMIFVISYVAMAWYDYYYECRILPFKRGRKSLTGLFKPNLTEQQKIDQDSISSNKKGKLVIYASHIIFIVPLLLYIVYYKNKVNKMVYPILVVLSLFTLIYHGGAMITGSHNL